jgi:hypothetical protein
MLEALREIVDYDTIFFVPHPEDDSQVKLEVAKYKEMGEKLDVGLAGDSYDIILFRLNEEEEITDLDKFQGVLSEPREYISRMIKDDWYGMVSRKTTTSHRLVDDVFAKWNSYTV